MHIADYAKASRRISKRLTTVKKNFVKSLCSLLDDSFYEMAGPEKKLIRFQSENIEKNIGAAYDLRSNYVHSGVSFGRLIRPSRDHSDLQSDKLVVETADREFAKTFKKAPKFTGLERLIRYCILKFMSSHKLLVFDPK